jgi:hypothetical protein
MRTFILPSTPIARAVLVIARDAAHPTLLNHSLRTYWLARGIAEERGVLSKLSDDLLFAATVMHELGATAKASGRERFEIEGADIAAGALLDLGVEESDAQQVWDAIALHTSSGLAERRGLLAGIVRAGILADFQPAPAAQQALQDGLHATWPRFDLETRLVDSILSRAQTTQALPQYGFGGVLFHERTTHGVTEIEAAAWALGR